jgi:ABC-type transporter Mla subunit MlaD
VENLTRDLNGLLSAENVAAAGMVLENTSTAMQDISSLSRQSQELVARLEKTADSIDSAAAALNDMVQTAAPNISRFSQEGLRDIEQTSKAARKMADRIRKTVDELGDDPSQIIYPAPAGGTAIPH